MIKKKRKVLLIGWDGADWEHIHPLLDQGLLPTLNNFVNQGTIGNLATLQPVLSPMLWNSVATCKFADKHGIHGFTEPEPEHGGCRPFSSMSRKTKALWNIFSQSGIRSNVINWWASHPAEKIDGVVVSNLFNGVRLEPESGWVITPGTVHPESKARSYAPLKFFPTEMSTEHILPFIPNAGKIDQENDPRLSNFAKTFAEMMTTHSIATAVMEREPWDFMAVYYTGIDHFSHGFMQYHPPKMEAVSDEDFEMYKDVITGAYRFHDMMLERLLQLAGEDTTVVLCSDHGFQSGAFRPIGTPREPAGPAYWHRQYGILAMKGEGIKKDERIYGASLIDVGPTILQMFGLPIGEDMDGRPLVEAFEGQQNVKTIPSWDDVEGNHGMPTGKEGMGAAESKELLKQFVALGYIDDQGDNLEKQADSSDIESKYNLARCLLWQEKLVESQGLLEEIVQRAPWEDRFILYLADCYLRQNYFDQTKQLLQAAYDFKNTAQTQAIVTYAKACLETDEFEKGLGLLGLAAKRQPRFPYLHVEIGKAFANQRQWDQAEASYKSAAALNPEYARAHQGLSTVYLYKRQNQQAAESALRAVGLIHRLPMAHLNLGIALARTRDFDRALLAFQTAARFAPNNPKMHNWLSLAYQNLGKQKQADASRLRALELKQFASDSKPETEVRKKQLFPIPNFESEVIRRERLLKERPLPEDPVKKSGKKFIIVSGLPRSGTSLMMQMLEAGGVGIVSDGQRQADTDNPKGYCEWEDIKKIGDQPEILDDENLNGRAIKAVSMLLDKLPKEHDYKTIFMVRPIGEIVESQQKMISRAGTSGAELDEVDLRRGLREHRKQSLAWLKKAAHMDSLEVSYPNLVADPRKLADEVINFLGEDYDLDIEQMIAAVDHSLYRNRKQN